MMLRLRQTYFVLASASCSRVMRIICSSVNLESFISATVQSEDFTQFWTIIRKSLQVLCNLVTQLTGTQYGGSKQHIQAYLNEFTVRFNRQFYPLTLTSLFGIVCDAIAPTYAPLFSADLLYVSPSLPE